MKVTRRAILKGTGALLAGTFGLSGYALAEPFSLRVTRYAPQLPRWPSDLHLRVAILADLHACEPWMTAGHIRSIVAATNALRPDVILLLGDYVVAHRWVSGRVPANVWAGALAGLSAPLGVHAVLGNHDWWDDPIAQRRGHGPTAAEAALTQAGIRVYHNQAVRLAKDGRGFWLAGLGDQFAVRSRDAFGRRYSRGVDDLRGTLAQIEDDAPVILMAHEPDVFPRVPPRVALTVSGHTHGGQIRIFGTVPYSPSIHREPYIYGHYREHTSPRFANGERNLIVSGGLGCSILPIRFGVQPEIVLAELGASAAA